MKSKGFCRLGVVAHIFNDSAQKAETGGSLQVQVELSLRSKLQDHQIYIEQAGLHTSALHRRILFQKRKISFCAKEEATTQSKEMGYRWEARIFVNSLSNSRATVQNRKN